MKKFLCFVLTVFFILAVMGCGGEKKAAAPAQKAVSETVLRVGTNAKYPPFEYYQNASKAFIGFDVDLMQGVAREMGYNRVEFVDMEFNKLIPSLKEGKVDAVISCLAVTDDRRKEVDFTQPYLVSGNVAVGSSDTETRSTGAMKGKRIAVEADSIHAKQARQYSGTVIECEGAEEALKLIMDKKADFAIMDNYTARFFITHFYNGKLSITAELQDDTDNRVGIAVAKGNKELMDKLNTGLRKYREDAAYYQMKNNYFGKLL
ncbi:MAG: ABC transporter substrate-binding protein [Succiniclasticum sp.]|uniref:substrate-binding periplasmic protein n=1 Tax=Succiniclasticum sp. TaxID=2775030 RepID=UPI002A91E06A|nr:ABC transporter substrate-binding protein [Succiniclasticum sp.]MBR1495782.1 amino acid ABC transporter substrate-binding protein [Acidaminococcaceae bacterium]MDY6291871.1 ABC transporter substrate-binding protein [Succiniclasticum sp.]